jgi:hypothetical protein
VAADFDAGAQPQLGQQGRHVGLDRVAGQHEFPSDVRIGQPQHHQARDALLGRGERGPTADGAPVRAAGAAADPVWTYASAGPPDDPGGAEAVVVGDRRVEGVPGAGDVAVLGEVDGGDLLEHGGHKVPPELGTALLRQEQQSSTVAVQQRPAAPSGH